MAKSPISSTVWAIGLVSLLMDLSSEMVHSVLPLFMTTLGASALDIGLIEGISEASALIAKVFSGTLSDYWGKRKPIAFIGYAMGALSKPLLAIAPSSGIVLISRLVDRLGKGVRGAPRDALVADVCPPETRGRAYGIRQTLDATGSFLGPLLVAALLGMTTLDFRNIFWIATLPAMIAVLVLWLGVQEPERTNTPHRIKQNPISWLSALRLGKAFWLVVILGSLMTLARFSEAFLILRAQQDNWPTMQLPLLMVTMNIAYACSAYPFGRLSDRYAPSGLLMLGTAILMLADLVLSTSWGGAWLWFAVILWGLHFGITQGLLTKMIADTAPHDLRGTAFGVFNVIAGLALLIASGLAGWLWDHWGWSVTFKFGALFCAITLIALPVVNAFNASKQLD